MYSEGLKEEKLNRADKNFKTIIFRRAFLYFDFLKYQRIMINWEAQSYTV
jgi:hypothetical protein